jgi:hypothetical protein
LKINDIQAHTAIRFRKGYTNRNVGVRPSSYLCLLFQVACGSNNSGFNVSL